MENEIFKEILQELNWKQKILVKVFKKDFMVFYHKVRLKTINDIL